MGGDYTRWSFDPTKDYAELFKQQGRVDLDADWNELVEIVNRRWRAETIDIIGRAVVPESTPNAFFITPTGPGQFSIGVGRMYVDGLLAECHGVAQGVPPTTYDASLGEVVGNAQVPFNNQPYYPNPTPLPSGAGTTDLIYLDVWSREVTAMQDPVIREKALGGPDTATRAQTVWQVKVLPDVGQVGCGDDIPRWDTLTAPSAGRLTTSTVAPAPSPDPCILSPTGGYRGLENRLYRVEVHVSGTVGGASAAKFKWSRDNASVVSAVTGISAPGGPNSVVTLKSLGRDRVLRFQADDWVEILDDDTEFAGTAGFLTKITTPPDQANRTITVNPPIPAGLFDPTNDQRHTRVRRWDERFTGAGSDVDPATGLITVTAGPLDIEDGIQVSFSDDPVGGQLHVGDYWVFAARTVDGSVEPLQEAPPRGILHHYARLGFVTWTATSGQFSNCRQFWPPPLGGGDCTGCCTVTVGDGVVSQGSFSDIQAAIDFLGTAGGEVCLGRGVFMVPNGIRIDATKKNVTVRGMGWATRLIFAPDPQSGSRILFDVSTTSHVILESFFAVAESAQSMVRFTDSEFCAVRDTALINLNISPASGTAFVSSEALSGRAIELAGTCVGFEIERNLLLAAKGIVSVASAQAPGTGAINGAVTDASGAALPNVAVTLTQPDGTTQAATTDAAGKFAFSSLPPGSYTVAASAAGLTSQQAVTVVANSTVNVNLVLPAAGPGFAARGPAARVSASAPAASVSTAAFVAGRQSNVREISIRTNRILATQVSVFLLRTEECDIVGNQALGIGKEAQAELEKFASANSLTRTTIDSFQQTVLSVLTKSSGAEFQAAAIVLLFGARVTIAENLITGLVGVFSFFLVTARVKDNQVLAFVALLVLNGLAIRIVGNFIAGLLAGWIQAGLLLDFVSESNLWIGLLGLLFLPFTFFQKLFGSLFSTALQSGGFATSGDVVTTNAGGAVNSVGASLGPLGLVGLVKIHHEVFFTFETGIAAFPGIMSGDVTIFDNSFEVCQAAGIFWDTPVRSRTLSNLLPPLHVVESNTFNVQGAGVRCICVEGVFRGNTVQCPEAGIEVRCQSGVVEGNTIAGTATQSSTLGLITIGPLAAFTENTSFRVAGNRVENGQGHGILISGTLSDLRIEDNVIRSMALNGITTASGAVLLQTVRISGNDVSNCQGGGPNVPFGSGGAIILPDVQVDLWVHGNRVLGNGGIGMFLNGTFVAGTATPPLRLRVQDNSQDGDGINPLIIAAGGAVQFTSNQCILGLAQQVAGPLVTLTGQMIVANANTVLGVQQQATFVPSSLVLNPSNILNGPPQGAGFATFVNNDNIAT